MYNINIYLKLNIQFKNKYLILVNFKHCIKFHENEDNSSNRGRKIESVLTKAIIAKFFNLCFSRITFDIQRVIQR